MTEEIFDAEFITTDDDPNPNGTPQPREVAVYRAPPSVPDVVDGWVDKARAVFALADKIADTDFVPDEMRDRPAAVAACILTGRELGLGPMQSLMHVQVVKGRPTLSAEYKRARVLAAGHGFEILERTTTRCRVQVRRRGEREWTEFKFTLDDAKQANLVKSGPRGPGAWITRPRRMLFARCSTEACDALFSDVTNGLPTTELIADGEFDEFAGYDEPPASTPDERDKAGRTRQRKTPAKPEPNPGPEPEPPAAGPAVDVAGPEPEPAPEPDNHLSAADLAVVARREKPKAKRNARDQIMKHFRDAGADTDQATDHRHAVIAAIIERPLDLVSDISATGQLTDDEASTVADTLAHWMQQARDRVEQIKPGFRKKDDLKRVAYQVMQEQMQALREVRHPNATEAEPMAEDPPFPEDFPDTPLPTSDPG